MSQDQSLLQEYVLRYFHSARIERLHIGIRELLAVWQLIDTQYIQDLGKLKSTILLVWGCSPIDSVLLSRIFDEVHIEDDVQDDDRDSHDFKQDLLSRQDFKPIDEVIKPPETVPLEQKSPQKEGIGGIQTMPFSTSSLFASNALYDEDVSTNAYYPVSRRFMSYTWRYLRNVVADGPRTVIDFRKTIAQMANYGRLTGFVWRRQELSRSHLVLFVDRDGSMVPFHRYVDDIIDTAYHASSIERVDTFYFHNVPHDTLSLDEYFTQPVEFQNVFNHLDSSSNVLIISDAGCARRKGGRNNDDEDLMLERVNRTLNFTYRIHQFTAKVAWLNPMPRTRWENCAAEFIMDYVPMFPMDQEGFRNAIDVLRGLHTTEQG